MELFSLSKVNSEEHNSAEITARGRLWTWHELGQIQKTCRGVPLLPISLNAPLLSWDHPPQHHVHLQICVSEYLSQVLLYQNLRLCHVLVPYLKLMQK